MAYPDDVLAAEPGAGRAADEFQRFQGRIVPGIAVGRGVLIDRFAGPPEELPTAGDYRGISTPVNLVPAGRRLDEAFSQHATDGCLHTGYDASPGLLARMSCTWTTRQYALPRKRTLAFSSGMTLPMAALWIFGSSAS